MQYLTIVAAYLAANWTAITDPAERDRGDSPVSTAVIVAIVAAGAVAVATAVIAVATGWVNIIPKAGAK
jgi:hypothetical protein